MPVRARILVKRVQFEGTACNKFEQKYRKEQEEGKKLSIDG